MTLQVVCIKQKSRRCSGGPRACSPLPLAMALPCSACLAAAYQSGLLCDAARAGIVGMLAAACGRAGLLIVGVGWGAWGWGRWRRAHGCADALIKHACKECPCSVLACLRALGAVPACGSGVVCAVGHVLMNKLGFGHVSLS